MNAKALADSLDRPARRRKAGPGTPASAGVSEQQDAPAPVSSLPAARGGARKRRLTVDLVTAEFRDFEDWRESLADDLGLARVTAQDALRQLVRQLLDDEALQRTLAEHLAAERTAR